MHGGPSGFQNAPITRTFVIASGFLTVIFGIRGRALKLGLSYQEIFKQFRLWRIVSSELAFSSTPELMFGLYLLYYFRVFERQIGSNKYSVFILFSLVVSFLLQALALFLLKDSSILLASGPYGLIFASFVPFYVDIPVSSKFNVLGINFTNKSFVYLAGVQVLLLSSLKRSLLPGICGILAGILYRANVFHVRSLKFPKSISSFFARLAWASGSPSAVTRTSSSRRGPRNMPNAGHQVEQNYPSATRAPVPEPTEDSIATLVSMGFDRNSARRALIQARNDVTVATNILLGS